ncbi:hypothetical protein O5D80_006794 [Batrachochytrium dendrobatidis]|nr:hypothetical protein O5D80_006794 [Batrachochytrium dendrobatidis]
MIAFKTPGLSYVPIVFGYIVCIFMTVIVVPANGVSIQPLLSPETQFIVLMKRQAPQRVGCTKKYQADKKLVREAARAAKLKFLDQLAEKERIREQEKKRRMERKMEREEQARKEEERKEEERKEEERKEAERKEKERKEHEKKAIEQKREEERNNAERRGPGKSSGKRKHLDPQPSEPAWKIAKQEQHSEQQHNEQQPKGAFASDIGFSLQCLQLHNQYRAKHGKAPLRHSVRLMESAKKIAGTPDMVHSKIPGNGESLWSGTSQDCTAAVHAFYDEVRYFGPETKVVDYLAVNKFAGHFTQVISPRSKEMGCAVGAKTVCHYSPPGNMMGETLNLQG